MASVFVMSGYLFFIGVIGYEANIGTVPEETPKGLECLVVRTGFEPVISRVFHGVFPITPPDYV